MKPTCSVKVTTYENNYQSCGFSTIAIGRPLKMNCIRMKTPFTFGKIDLDKDLQIEKGKRFA